MIPPIDAHQFSLVHHLLTARPTKRGGATTTHGPNEISDHARLTTDTYFHPATETSKSDEHVNFHQADLQALQYSQAIEDIEVNLATGGNQPVVLDGVNSFDTTMSPKLQLEALNLYSLGESQHIENIVVHTYEHDEAAIQAARTNHTHQIDSTM